MNASFHKTKCQKKHLASRLASALTALWNSLPHDLRFKCLSGDCTFGSGKIVPRSMVCTHFLGSRVNFTADNASLLLRSIIIIEKI
jgi:hypothetical protein